jgi:hypothetical protein
VLERSFSMKNKEYRNTYNKTYSASIRGRAHKMLHNAKRRSKTTEIPVTINLEWIENKLTCGICELTGMPFDLNPSKLFSSNPYAPSLDRINPKLKEYSPTNTRVVLAAVNIALNEYGEEHMLPILKAMVSKIENK